MRRRDLAFLALAPLPFACARADALADRLRLGACVVLLRHGRTTPGVGDPPGFRLDACSTQRNLSDEGRAASQRLGAWFKAAGLAPRAVRTSAWCRCRDTADLAFGTHTVWAPLNSTFQGATAEATTATAALRSALTAMPAGAFEVWVTHQVNITALTGEVPSMGEGLIVDAGGQVRGRSSFS
ncbi:MAG: histidine phosphatase family protein [Variovorax sp.]|nr:MAG: histidine phosphatase family protein [Variovorax sp.]